MNFMAKKKHITFGGVGEHEFYLPTTGKGHKNRRDRKKCKFYLEDMGYCSKIGNRCVGPTTCMKYKSTKPLNSGVSQAAPGIGTIVYSKNHGEGKIVTITNNTCTVLFSSGKKVPYKYPDALNYNLLTTDLP